jgi:hypothetical protein
LSADGGASLNVRYWSNSGQRGIFADDGLSAYDPKRTLNVA